MKSFKKFEEINERLAELKELPDNWDSYGAKHIGEECFFPAQLLAYYVADFISPNFVIFPMSDGISIQVMKKEGLCDIEVVKTKHEVVRIAIIWLPTGGWGSNMTVANGLNELCLIQDRLNEIFLDN